MKQKENSGNCRAKPKRNSALSKMKLPSLPDGIPDFPHILMKRGVHFSRTRQLYSQIAYALVPSWRPFSLRAPSRVPARHEYLPVPARVRVRHRPLARTRF